MNLALYVDEEGIAELVDEDDDDEILWSSDDDDDFDNDAWDDADEIVEYLARKNVIESIDDVKVIVDETGELPSLEQDGDFDDGDELTEVNGEELDDD